MDVYLGNDLVAYNRNCAPYRFVLGIISVTRYLLFVIKGKSPTECPGTEDDLDQKKSSQT